jgi:predicted metal-dependent enzyme (double-stranded beta helix superfamily)
MQLSECIAAIQISKQQNLTPEALVQQVAPVLAAFAADNDLGDIDFSTVSRGLYTRRLLTAPDADFQLILALWGPHSASPIHDHDQLTGAVVACMGQVMETKYQRIGSDHDRVQLKRGETINLGDGEVTPILPDEERQLHDMANTSDFWAATLHLYLSPLRNFRIYQPNADASFTAIAKTLWFD